MKDTVFPRIKRRYFEAFGDIEEEARFLRKSVFFLIAIIFFLIVFGFFIARRPPVVIRVSELKGAEVIHSLKENNAPNEHELMAFAKRFTVRYTAFNSYTVSRDLSEAFNQMTRGFQKKARKSLIDSGFLTKISEARIDTRVEFKEERIERDSGDAAVVSLVGLRQISKYGTKDFREEVLFRADIVLKKVARTSGTPEGLLVEEYREILLNELTERK